MSAGLKLLVFSAFPPPNTGQTLGTARVADLLEAEFQVIREDTSTGALDLGRNPLARLRKLLRRVGQGIRLRRLLREHRPQVLYFVLANSLPGQLRDLLTVVLAGGRVRRIVGQVHSGNFHEGLQGPVRGPLGRALTRRVHRLVFSSRTLADRSRPYLRASQVRVAPNPIDEAVTFSPREVQRKVEEVQRKVEEGGERWGFRVLYLSNMIREKGYEDAVEGFFQFLDQHPEVEGRMDLAGGWPSERERERLEGALRARPGGDRCRIHGAVTDRSRVRELLRQADAFVLPTYYPVEAQPFSVIEAMNAGVPVVATAHASLPEFLVDGKNGYLVPPRSPESIAEALARLLDPGTWAGVAWAGRRTFEERFSPEAIGSLYREILGGELED